jgi:hypothetical protein
MAAVHMPILMALKKCFIEIGALFLYALRDGYLRYWVKGCIDGFFGLKLALRHRVPISGEPKKKYLSIASKNPSFLYMIKIRIFKKSKKIRI